MMFYKKILEAMLGTMTTLERMRTIGVSRDFDAALGCWGPDLNCASMRNVVLTASQLRFLLRRLMPKGG